MTSIRSALVNWLSVRPVAQRVVRPLYHLQLAAFLAFALCCRGIVAVYLRRPGVLQDAVPGKSDYDLTCVVKARFLGSIGRKIRALRRFFPAAGEVWLVCEEYWEPHLRYAFPDYGAHPFAVLGTAGSSDGYGGVLSTSFVKFFQLVRLIVLPMFGGPNVPAGWEWSKIRRKLLWMHTAVQAGAAEGLTYRISPENATKAEDICLLIQELARELNSEASRVCRSADFRFRVVGELPAFDAREVAGLRSAYWRFVEDAGEVEQAFAFRHRPFRFINSFVLIARDPAAILTDSKRSAALRRLSRDVTVLDMGITPGCALLLSPDEWKLYATADPFAELYFRAMRLDLKTGAMLRDPISDFSIARDRLAAEITDAVVQCTSVAARTASNYLLDLWFGQIRLYRRSLERGTWDLSFDRAGNRALADIYLDATESEVDSIAISSIWRSIEEPLFEHLDFLRRSLHSVHPMHSSPSAENNFQVSARFR